MAWCDATSSPLLSFPSEINAFNRIIDVCRFCQQDVMIYLPNLRQLSRVKVPANVTV